MAVRKYMLLKNLTVKIKHAIIKTYSGGGNQIFMNKDEKATISILRILIITVIFIIVSGIVVMANDTKVKNIKIILPNNHEINVLTQKTKVGEILNQNNIAVLPDEIVKPDLDAELGQDEKIIITKKQEDTNQIQEVSQEEPVNLEEILSEYQSIIERIVVEEQKIPFETITKDTSHNSENSKSTVIQKGEEGLKKITYKIKYQNDIEISREVISEEIIKQPVNKIVQIQTVQTTSRGSTSVARESTSTLAKKVQEIEPTVMTMNVSAYAAETCGKSPSSSGYGMTSSGAKAQTWYTVAAGSKYKIGTVVYIPYFKDKPNGGWFVVQDRGGSISNNKLDIFMGSANECRQFGRRNLECYIYEM